MTSRQYHHKLRNKPVNDERRFNNFESFKPNTPLYCNYDKMLGKVDEDYSKYINGKFDLIQIFNTILKNYTKTIIIKRRRITVKLIINPKGN